MTENLLFDGKTDRQTNKQKDWHKQRKSKCDTDKQTGRQEDWQTERLTDTMTYRNKDETSTQRLTDKKIDRQKDWQTAIF